MDSLQGYELFSRVHAVSGARSASRSTGCRGVILITHVSLLP